MAKTSMIERDKKRTELVNRYKAKRDDLRAKSRNESLSFDERMAAVDALNKMPRDSAPIRQQRRCRLTGRPHGVYRKFGLSRIKLRELTMRGEIPGLRKASW
jgi:small subunit ribosomal protein S14